MQTQKPISRLIRLYQSTPLEHPLLPHFTYPALAAGVVREVHQKISSRSKPPLHPVSKRSTKPTWTAATCPLEGMPGEAPDPTRRTGRAGHSDSNILELAGPGRSTQTYAMVPTHVTEDPPDER